MPRNKKQPPNLQSDSFRWPKIFGNVEVASALVDSAGWIAMEQEWQEQLDTLTYKVVHNTTTMEQTNFLRGQIAFCEMMLGFREELAEWKKEHR